MVCENRVSRKPPWHESLDLLSRGIIIRSPELVFFTEIIFGCKKIFFTVLYRNPINKVGTPEFVNFVQNFETLNLKIMNENPYNIIFTGDFNAHSQLWWPNGDTTPEGKKLKILLHFLD